VPQIAVQSSHACIDACKSFDFASLSEHPSVIMCGVKTETQLENVCKRLEKQGIRFASFREPDIGDQLTSVCTEPIYGKDRDFFRKFQLLKEDTSKVYAVHYNNGQRSRERSGSFKKWAVEYKGGQCLLCGYNRCNDALQFHHRDSNEKDITPAKMRLWSKERAMVELDKCNLICSNCHAEVHFKERGGILS
jgi:hypothetical protein